MSDTEPLIEISRTLGRVEGKLDDLGKQNVRQEQINRALVRRLLTVERDVKRVSWLAVPVRWITSWFQRKAGLPTA